MDTMSEVADSQAGEEGHAVTRYHLLHVCSPTTGGMCECVGSGGSRDQRIPLFAARFLLSFGSACLLLRQLQSSFPKDSLVQPSSTATITDIIITIASNEGRHLPFRHTKGSR